MTAALSSATFTGWAIEALIASTILMIFVLLVRKEAQRALGPQLAYWLWALPALRMAMPPLPASWRESAAAPLSAASETVLVLVQPILPTATATTDAAPFPWLALVAGAWVLGALAFFTWHGLAHVSYVRRIISPPARRARLPDGTTLVESDEAVGPVAFGIFKRFVAVPSDFAERYDADERKLALAHELGHHARGDLFANWIALALLACHWFNPIAWIAYRKFRADQEMANDARVLSALPPIERHAYACAIVKAAHGRAVTAACHLHTIEDLKGRLRMLKASRKSRRVVMAGAVGIAGLTIAGLGLTASGAAAEKIRTVAETQVEAMAQAASPAAPPAPAVVVAKAGAPTPAVERKRRIVVVNGDKAVVVTEREPRASAPAAPPAPPVPGGATIVGPGGQLVVADTRSGTRISRIVRTGPAGYVRSENVLEVTEGRCGSGKASEFVSSDSKSGRARMVICTDRIEAFAAASQARHGKRAALASLTATRASIARTQGLSELQRERALAGLDEARAELEGEIDADTDN